LGTAGLVSDSCLVTARANRALSGATCSPSSSSGSISLTSVGTGMERRMVSSVMGRKESPISAPEDGELHMQTESSI